MSARPPRRGTIAIEFAFSLTILVALGLGVAQLGAFLSGRQRFVQATFETTRYAAITPEAPSQADIRAHAVLVLEEQGFDTTGLQVFATFSTDGLDDVVTVTMELPARTIAGTLQLPPTYTQQFTAVVKRS